jgi:hypothetical protein
MKELNLKSFQIHDFIIDIKASQNISGQWTGIITYGKNYGKNRNKQLYFDLEIQQDGEKINGTAIDIEGVDTSPDSAKISGAFINSQISFIKQYSSLHYYNKGKTKIDKSRLGNEIYYFGVYNEIEHNLLGLDN